MTPADIKDEILSELGSPVIKVEIDDTMWDGIFSKARRWFQSKKGVYALTATPVTNEIMLPPECIALVDVILPSGNFGLGYLASYGFFPDLVPADIFRLNGTGLTQGLSDISGFVQIIERNEKLLRVLGLDSGYVMGPLGDRIVLTNTRIASGGVAILVYVTSSWQIAQLKGRDEDMIYRYCFALAKRVLGRIRGKYASYPSAGGNIEMDSSVLLEESKEEITALEEELANSQYPIQLVTG